MLRQAAVLSGEGDRAVSVGPPPDGCPLPLASGSVHRPLGWAPAAGWHMRHLADGVDVLHAWSPQAMLAGRELSLATGKPLVASLPTAPAGAAADEMRRAVGPGLLHVTVPTEASRSALLAAGLPGPFVHVLAPAAAAPSRTDRAAARRSVRSALGIADAAAVAIVPDALVRWAGYDVAAWAHAIVRQVREGLHLLLPGAGPHEPRARFFAATTGCGGEVHFTGRRFAREDCFAAADLAAVLHRRPLGLCAAADAMAAGLPLIASRTADLAEHVADGREGLLVRPGSPRDAAAALLRLLEDGELAARLGAAGRSAAAERFDPAACRGRLEEIRGALADTPACAAAGGPR